ncbi:hypothetical protein HMI56_004483, partial [Coelomomyces lativittatus]
IHAVACDPTTSRPLACTTLPFSVEQQHFSLLRKRKRSAPITFIHSGFTSNNHSNANTNANTNPSTPTSHHPYSTELSLSPTCSTTSLRKSATPLASSSLASTFSTRHHPPLSNIHALNKHQDASSSSSSSSSMPPPPLPPPPPLSLSSSLTSSSPSSTLHPPPFSQLIHLEDHPMDSLPSSLPRPPSLSETSLHLPTIPSPTLLSSIPLASTSSASSSSSSSSSSTGSNVSTVSQPIKKRVKSADLSSTHPFFPNVASGPNLSSGT